jgi:two-component system C4-dicarboxylate transport sensor histidine kinase DctB
MVLAGHHYAERYFLAETARQGRASIGLHLELVRGWLNRYRSLAPVYARDPAVIGALSHPDDGVQLDLVNDKLAAWTTMSGASDTYLLDTRGTAIAASNWSDPVSFVGKDYSYRPYFAHAMEGRLGRFFALGTASRKRGYYFSHPVRAEGRIIGVAVVKVGVEEIEQDLRSSANAVFVSDGSGVIVLAGHPEWRLTTLGPLTPADRARIVANRQFDLEALSPVSIEGIAREPAPEFGVLVEARPDRSDARLGEFLHLTQPMAVEGWRMHLLADTKPARAQALTATALMAALILAAGLGLAAFLQHRRRLMERLGERARNEALLESKVVERTTELRESNLMLEEEIAERVAAEEELRRTQADLVQAGKLAALGQMSAALSHEFNQPLTAVRTYAENALAFLDRGRREQAVQNISRISTLTERMAQLSRHLTSFARKPGEGMGPIRLNAVFDEVLGLLQGRLERAEIVPQVTGLDSEIEVTGGMVRLQHVFMNLIGNAIDALANRPDPRIAITVRAEDDTATVTVEDNGPGIAETDIENVFDPFFTTKEVGKGLGLGLSITYNIIRDFDGTIRAENRPEGGARFTVTLRRTVATGVEAAE